MRTKPLAWNGVGLTALLAESSKKPKFRYCPAALGRVSMFLFSDSSNDAKGRINTTQQPRTSYHTRATMNNPGVSLLTCSRKAADSKIRTAMLLAALLGAAVTSSTFGADFSTNGLIGYYPFNGSAANAVNHLGDGSNLNARSSTDRFGRPNAAYDFNGVDSLIRIESSPLLDSLSAITVAAWIHPRITTQFGGIVTRWNQDHTLGDNFGLWFSDGAILAGSHEHYFTSTATSIRLTNDSWSMITYTISAIDGVERLFLDGELLGEVETSQPPYSTDIPVLIGADMISYHFDNYWRYFAGEIDDVRIYTRALSPDEVRSLFRLDSEVLPSLAISVHRTIGPTIDLRAQVIKDRKYVLQTSADLEQWETHDTEFVATSSEASFVIPAPAPRRFFRLRQL